MKGYFEQQSGERIAFPSVVGKWDDSMTAVLADGTSRLLWKKADPPTDPTRCRYVPPAVWSFHLA